ncbi:hypothetical protein GJAV_G00109880 [Gymnothorax javanicus]|nr:hypothetical protein GJAV_G00109880 [Gymnothorax javanicus]
MAARGGGSGGGACAAGEGPVGIPFPEHSSELLGALNAQRLSGRLCDVLLVAQEREFPAHRSVLASCSSYFHQLFTSGPAADRQSVYTLEFVRAEALAALLDFAYTATLTVSCASVGDILRAARLLEIQPVRDVCSHLLESKVLYSQSDDEPGEAEEAEGRERGKEEGDGERTGRRQALEYLQSFQQGEMWDSESASPELRDPVTHPHFTPPNGADRDIAEYAAHPPRFVRGLGNVEKQEEEGREEEVDAERAAAILAWARANKGGAAAAFFDPPQNGNGHYYLQPAPKPGTEQGMGKGRGRGRGMSASVLLQQMMDSIERQKEWEEPGPVVDQSEGKKAEEDGEGDVEFYLKYFNSVRQEGGARAMMPLPSPQDSGSPAPSPSPGSVGSVGRGRVFGEKKTRSKAFQKCPICSKVIQGAGKLPRHIRTHTGEKPYECSVCKVRFTRQDKLKVHMRKHTGEKPYICPDCGASFAHNYDLKNHLRVHTGLRPYQCPTCLKTFVRSDHLHRHLKKDDCTGVPPRRGRKPRNRVLEGPLEPATELLNAVPDLQVAGAGSGRPRLDGAAAFALARDTANAVHYSDIASPHYPALGHTPISAEHLGMMARVGS